MNVGTLIRLTRLLRRLELQFATISQLEIRTKYHTQEFLLKYGLPNESVPLLLQNGIRYVQKIEFEHIPKLCSKRNMFGHYDSACSGPDPTTPIANPEKVKMPHS